MASDPCGPSAARDLCEHRRNDATCRECAKRRLPLPQLVQIVRVDGGAVVHEFIEHDLDRAMAMDAPGDWMGLTAKMRPAMARDFARVKRHAEQRGAER